MIDYVALQSEIKIPNKMLKNMLWQTAETDDGNTFFWYTFRGVKIRYYPHTTKLTIKGKLITLLYDTQVLNVDDIYGKDLDHFIDDINDHLNRLFTTPILDIRDFVVTRIDYCFNVKTEHVCTYIAFLNKAFSLLGSDLRKNYTLEKQLDGSVYIKTASDYKNNSHKNYVLNFYEKTCRLLYQTDRGENISNEDFVHAEDVFRLEVQCGYEMIQYICKKYGIEKIFSDLFDYRIALYAIDTVYRRIFHADETQDYFTYKAAKKNVSSSKAKDALYILATNHAISGKEYAYSREQIKVHDIYPYCLLPKSRTLSTLENPLKLIRSKLTDLSVLS